MKIVLLLLTEAFPLTINAEAFLEPEVEIAASYFDEVYIFPSSRKKKSKNDRNVSMQNVSICPVRRDKLLFEFAESIPYIFKHKGFWQDVRMFAKNGLFYYIGAWKKLFYTLLTEKAIMRHFKNTSFNLDKETVIVIYSYWLFGEAGGAMAIKKLFKNNKTFVIARAHGSDIMGYPSLKSYSPLKKYHMDGLDRIYPVSQNGKSILVEQYRRYGADSNTIIEKIYPIHLGIEDIAESEKLPTPNASVFTILSCSSVIPVKRVHLIVEALSLIRTKKIRWIHLGGGELLEEIKMKSHEILGDNIFFEFRGSLSRKAVVDFYKTNDIHIFVNVSSSEGIPVSIMEAFSFGIPAIATNVGGISELCHDGINGFLLQKDFEPEALCDLILKIINFAEDEYEKYILIRRSARKTILREFSIENHRTFYESIITKVYGDFDDCYFRG